MSMPDERPTNMSDTDDLKASAASGPLKEAQPPVALEPRQLRGTVALSAAELERAAADTGVQGPLGQERALDAIRMGIGIDAPGYNVYVCGLRTREERDSTLRLIAEKAATMPVPGDWVYVNNFRSPESPRAIYLKPGEGCELRDRMQELVNLVLEQLPKAFHREDFEQERAALRDKYNRRAQELFGSLEAHARERGFVIQSAPGGQVLFIPMIGGKAPESPEELSRLMGEMAEEEREKLAKRQGELQDELGSLMLRQQELMHDLVEEIRSIERNFATRLIAPAVTALKQRFLNPGVDAYLEEVVEHIVSHLDRFREAVQARGGDSGRSEPGDAQERFAEYRVNVLVDNSRLAGAPVVSEDAPTYRNLFGTIERWVDPMGRGMTNFTRIIAGSVLRSQGGFLVFDLEDAVVEPSVWRTLKRTFKTGRMTIETFEPFAFFSISGLKPEPIEVRNKVVVLGSRYLYNMLYFYDQDFAELFKVKAEMRPVVEAGAQAARHYASRIGTLVRREGLPEFDGRAVERIVEFGMRTAGDRALMVSAMEPADDLAREASYFARSEGAAKVSDAHVERALSERVLRLNFIEEEIRRLIANGTLVIRLEGRVAGEVNGLAVLDVGAYAFGRPSRVTAAVSVGRGGVVNIEREARLSGATHDKGVMILSGFFRSRFGQQHPITMTATLCFEQSYSGVDGDSASSTELYALLSALSGVALRQDLAVTGSVDQHGRIQAIGGANEKIEGFYRVCKAVGLTGTQGVLLPKANLANLMLEREVITAVEQGRFHIYPIETIDQGIEILTGIKAGEVDEPATINFLVAERLKQMAATLGKGEDGAETHFIHTPAPEPVPPAPPSPPKPPAAGRLDR